MPELTKVVGSRVRARRQELGWTQARLAEAATVSTELVSRIERAMCLPSVPTLVAFAGSLGTTTDWLLGLERPRKTKDVDALIDTVRRLPTSRRKEIQRIAEALADYESRRD